MPDTNCKSIFLIENPVLNGSLKIIGAQNQLPITFCSDLVCNKTLKSKDYEFEPHTHDFLTFTIPIAHTKSDTKIVYYDPKS